MAERGRTRAFADLLVERQTGQQDLDAYSPATVEQILDAVNKQRALVLYFSLAAGYLYSWLLAPGAGEMELCVCVCVYFCKSISVFLVCVRVCVCVDVYAHVISVYLSACLC